MAKQDAVKQLRVLFVDDDADTVLMFHRILAVLDCEAHGCRDGRECLAAARGLKPHIILIDLAMPGMDGFELVSAIKAEITPPPLLIAVTGLVSQAMRDHCLTHGFHHHEPKPITMDRLKELLNAARDLRRA